MPYRPQGAGSVNAVHIGYSRLGWPFAATIKNMPPAQSPSSGVRRSGGSGDIRHGNLTQILRFVRDHGPSSRHDIARGCGLGISTMTDLVGELRARRLVRELDPVRRLGAGRPTRPIALDGEPWCVLGAHLELDQVRFSVATVGGRELWQDTVALERPPPGSSVDLGVLSELLARQLSRLTNHRALVAIEVAVPGFVTGDGGTVSWSANLGWADLPLRALLEDFLVQRGVRDVHVGISNDSQLAALYATRVELELSATSVAVYFGGRRGLGGAIMIDGEIFAGAQGGAGDFAHLHIDPAGTPDVCGRRGCLESLVGPQQLLLAAGLLPADDAAELVRADPGHAIRLLTDALARGDPRALTALTRAGTALGRAVDNIIGSVNPDAVILGGYLGLLSPYLIASIESTLAGRLGVAAFAATRVVALADGDRHVVIGATLAARDACLYDPLAWTRPLLT